MKKPYYWLMELLFPRKCILCRRLLRKEELDLCGNCRTEVPAYPNKKRQPHFLDSFAAVWYYEDSVRTSLLRYKFYGARSYASSYGRLLAMKIRQENLDETDLLTWVPVSRKRKLRRGYDQVELIAKAVGRELELPCQPTLKKIHHNRPQSGIQDAAKRKANVLGVYRVVCPQRVAGKRVLLLDDILTTGATMSEAARVLKSSGAKEVHCAAVAVRK